MSLPPVDAWPWMEPPRDDDDEIRSRLEIEECPRCGRLERPPEGCVACCDDMG